MPEDELVAAASQLRLDDVNIARSFCKVFAARARAAEAHRARAKAFDEWRRCTERAAPAAPGATQRAPAHRHTRQPRSTRPRNATARRDPAPGLAAVIQ